MASGVEHKDVVLAFLGASAGLAGLVLVFLGLVVAAYGGLAGDTPRAVKSSLRLTGGVIFIPFALAVACIAVSAAWLILLRTNQSLYVAVVLLFVLELVALAGSAWWALRRLLWD